VDLGFWTDLGERQQVMDILRRDGTLREHPCRFRMRNGEVREYLVSSAVIDLQGVPCSLNFFVDITDRTRAETERRELQAQLLQAQKMESLGSLAGGVAHDMNNVLGAILGLASARLETEPEDSPARPAFETICKAALRGGSMVKSLLRFAHQSPQAREEMDLNLILVEEVQLLERTTLSRVRLEMDLAEALPPIHGDAGAIAHAFMNLCVNAVDAMPEGGRLALRTRTVDDAWVEVEVQDTGTGMTKEVLDRAMDPYFTTKETGKGTGLGLSLVYSTVTSHQGQIAIQSTPGEGTRVTVRFPICESPRSVLEPPREPRPGRSRTPLQVLLVDDDALIQDTVQSILKSLGHSVIAVLSGEEALLRIEAGARPDLVILDMNMPGWGGRGTLPRLRTLLPTVPVLIATGRPDPAVSALASAHPFVSLMPKPFTLGQLQARLEALCP
jgi:signal transduction histidine kinase